MVVAQASVGRRDPWQPYTNMRPAGLALCLASCIPMGYYVLEQSDGDNPA